MVKKASLFRRLKERWTSPSGLRVSEGRADARSGNPRSKNAHGSRLDAGQVEDLEAESRLAEIPPERRSARKLNRRDEAKLTVDQGFQELATLMRGVQSRLDSTGIDLNALGENLRSLPAASQAQLEALRAMAAHMEKQNQLGEVMVKGLGELPETLRGVKEALARAAATDERTSRTLGEFQDTMGRIQGSMDQMVDQSREQAESVRSLAGARETEAARQAEAIHGAVHDLESSQKEAVADLRRAQADQTNRLTRVVEDNGKWHQALIVMLGLVVVGLGAVLAILLAQ